MRVSLELPDGALSQLVEAGRDVSRTVLEALAIDAYRVRRMTGRQLCHLLDIPSRYELDGFLKQHGVPLEYSLDDFEREAATGARLWEKRQTPLGPDDDRRPDAR